MRKLFLKEILILIWVGFLEVRFWGGGGGKITPPPSPPCKKLVRIML